MLTMNMRQLTAAPTSREDAREEVPRASGMLPGPEGLEDRALNAITVPVRLEWFDDRIRTIQLTVIDLDDLTEELRLDGETIGFIGRADRVFVAHTGTRLDRAEECGQYLLWDKAASILVTRRVRRSEPEEHVTRVGAPERATDRNDGAPGQASTHQRSRAHEMSR